MRFFKIKKVSANPSSLSAGQILGTIFNTLFGPLICIIITIWVVIHYKFFILPLSILQ
jgi:hypothetical protein